MPLQLEVADLRNPYFLHEQLVLLPGLPQNTLQLLIPDVCSESLCFKTWHHQSWWQTPPHLSWQSILLSCALRLHPGGQKQSTLPVDCPRPFHSYSLPFLHVQLRWCFVCSPSQSLFMASWAISSVWLLSTGRKSMRIFAPELLCSWQSTKKVWWGDHLLKALCIVVEEGAAAGQLALQTLVCSSILQPWWVLWMWKKVERSQAGEQLHSWQVLISCFGLTMLIYAGVKHFIWILLLSANEDFQLCLYLCSRRTWICSRDDSLTRLALRLIHI